MLLVFYVKRSSTGLSSMWLYFLLVFFVATFLVFLLVVFLAAAAGFFVFDVVHCGQQPGRAKSASVQTVINVFFIFFLWLGMFPRYIHLTVATRDELDSVLLIVSLV